MAEQLETYNQQLDDAAEGFRNVKEAFPQLEINEAEISQYKIAPETTSIKEIMSRPVQQDLEDQLGENPGTSEAAEDYEQLVQQQGGK